MHCQENCPHTCLSLICKHLQCHSLRDSKLMRVGGKFLIWPRMYHKRDNQIWDLLLMVNISFFQILVIASIFICQKIKEVKRKSLPETKRFWGRRFPWTCIKGLVSFKSPACVLSMIMVPLSVLLPATACCTCLDEEVGQAYIQLNIFFSRERCFGLRYSFLCFHFWCIYYIYIWRSASYLIVLIKRNF